VIGERFVEHVADVVDEDWGGVTVVGEAEEGEREGPAAGAVLGDVVDVEGGTEGGGASEGAWASRRTVVVVGGLVAGVLGCTGS
jgi:hypothetical protein